MRQELETVIKKSEDSVNNQNRVLNELTNKNNNDAQDINRRIQEIQNTFDANLHQIDERVTNVVDKMKTLNDECKMKAELNEFRDFKNDFIGPLNELKRDWEELGKFNVVRLRSLSLAERNKYLYSNITAFKNGGFAENNPFVREILFTNDRKYVFVCNLYLDCMF